MWEGLHCSVVSESARLKFMTVYFPRSFLLSILYFWGSESVTFYYSYVIVILAFPMLCGMTTEVWLVRDNLFFP